MKKVSSTLGSIDQNALSQQIYERLKANVLNGSFTFNERLSTEDLAAHFQVSAMPVRDALKLLEADGLVEIVPRRGAFVTSVGREDVEEIFQIRQIIECAAVENLAFLADAIIEQLRTVLQQMEALRVGESYSEYPQYVQLDARFHSLIVAIPGNTRLSELYQGLHWPIQLLLVLSKSEHQRARQTMDEHGAIVDALVARDVIKAQRVISTHLRNAKADLISRVPAT